MSQPNDESDDETIASAVTAERIALCTVLEQLEPEDWMRASLCEGWRVRDVAGHLALATNETVREMAVGMFKTRGNFDRMTKETAIARAQQLGPDELISQIRSTADSTRRAPMSSPLDPLVDILVHTQDITRPLERLYTPSPDRVVPALTHAVNSRWYGGVKRFANVTLSATDTTWIAGSGDNQVSGPAIDLLLMATGRPAGLDGLDGLSDARLGTG